MQTVVSTPDLEEHSSWYGEGIWRTRWPTGWSAGDVWMQRKTLDDRFFLPEDLDHIRVELSTSQWPDRSGHRIEAWFILGGVKHTATRREFFWNICTLCVDFGDGRAAPTVANSGGFLQPFDRLMYRLGVRTKKAVLYVRVVYWETRKTNDD